MLNNPIYEFEKMRSILNDLFLDSDSARFNQQDLDQTNLYENDSGYMLQFLAPGVQNENISIDYANSILSIHVKRALDNQDKDQWKKLRAERINLDFTRSYRLSDDADVDKIDAKVMNGLLMLHIPKKESAKPKKIEVKVN